MDEQAVSDSNDASPYQKSSKMLYIMISAIILLIIALFVVYFTLFDGSSGNSQLTSTDACAVSEVLTIKNDAEPHDIAINSKPYKITLIFLGFSQGISSLRIRLEGDGINEYVEKVVKVGETFEISSLSIYLRVNYADTQGIETVIAVFDSACMNSKKQMVEGQDSKTKCSLNYDCSQLQNLNEIEITKCALKERDTSAIANIRMSGDMEAYWKEHPPSVREFTQEIICPLNPISYRASFASQLRLYASLNTPSLTKQDLKNDEPLLLKVITNASENLTLRSAIIEELSNTYYYMGMTSAESANFFTALESLLTQGDDAALAALGGLDNLYGIDQSRVMTITNQFIANNKDNFTNMQKSMTLALTWQINAKDSTAIEIAETLCAQNASYLFCRYVNS